MTTAEWLAFHASKLEQMKAITKAKSNDYSGQESPFNNFQNVERLGITTTEHGFLVRMTDKLARLAQYVNSGTLLVKDESAEDTLLDLANYALLMLGYLHSKKSLPQHKLLNKDKI